MRTRPEPTACRWRRSRSGRCRTCPGGCGRGSPEGGGGSPGAGGAGTGPGWRGAERSILGPRELRDDRNAGAGRRGYPAASRWNCNSPPSAPAPAGGAAAPGSPPGGAGRARAGPGGGGRPMGPGMMPGAGQAMRPNAPGKQRRTRTPIWRADAGADAGPGEGPRWRRRRSGRRWHGWCRPTRGCAGGHSRQGRRWAGRLPFACRGRQNLPERPQGQGCRSTQRGHRAAAQRPNPSSKHQEMFDKILEGRSRTPSSTTSRRSSRAIKSCGENPPKSTGRVDVVDPEERQGSTAATRAAADHRTGTKRRAGASCDIGPEQVFKSASMAMRA